MKKKAPAVVVEWSELEEPSYDCNKWVEKRKVFATVGRFATWICNEIDKDVPWKNVFINGERWEF